MGSEEFTALQENIINEIYGGCGYPVCFHGVYFRSDLLQVDSENEKTASCQVEIAPKLELWKGPVLCEKWGEEVPPMDNRSKSYEFVVGLFLT